MSQLVSWLLSSLGNILPFQSDTAPSKCPYIVNRDKEGEYICGVMSQSGLLCAKHKNRRPQVHYSDKEAEEEEETPPTERSKNKGRRTRESTPETSTPSRPKTAPSKPASPSATKTPTHPRTPRNKSSSTSTTDTPTSAEPTSASRRSTRKHTPEATPKPASTRKLRSSLPGADSTPPTSTGKSGDGIEELTGRLEELDVGDEDYIDRHLTHAEPLISASVASCGPYDPRIQKYDKYMPDGLHASLYKRILYHLSSPIWKHEERGYVYVAQVIPYTGEAETTEKENEKKILLKIGASKDVIERSRNLPAKCRYHEYRYPEGWWEIGPVALKYKTEKLVHAHMRGFHYDSKCLCDSRHTEFFEVKPEELKVIYDSVKYWASIVNDHKDEIWPGALNKMTPS
jgi:hypothetical protein